MLLSVQTDRQTHIWPNKLPQLPVQLVTDNDGSRKGKVLPLFVCVFVFFPARYHKNRSSYDHQSWHRNVPRWVLETHLFLDSKGQRLMSRVTKTLPPWVFALLWLLAPSRYIVIELIIVTTRLLYWVECPQHSIRLEGSSDGLRVG